MPPPPPPGPPPPPAPPPPGPPKLSKTDQNSRGALLNQINNGQPKLKSAKHLMNDRSGPSIDGKKSEGASRNMGSQGHFQTLGARPGEKKMPLPGTWKAANDGGAGGRSNVINGSDSSGPGPTAIRTVGSAGGHNMQSELQAMLARRGGGGGGGAVNNSPAPPAPAVQPARKWSSAQNVGVPNGTLKTNGMSAQPKPNVNFPTTGRGGPPPPPLRTDVGQQKSALPPSPLPSPGLQPPSLQARQMMLPEPSNGSNGVRRLSSSSSSPGSRPLPPPPSSANDPPRRNNGLPPPLPADRAPPPPQRSDLPPLPPQRTDVPISRPGPMAAPPPPPRTDAFERPIQSAPLRQAPRNDPPAPPPPLRSDLPPPPPPSRLSSTSRSSSVDQPSPVPPSRVFSGATIADRDTPPRPSRTSIVGMSKDFENSYSFKPLQSLPAPMRYTGRLKTYPSQKNNKDNAARRALQAPPPPPQR